MKPIARYLLIASLIVINGESYALTVPNPLVSDDRVRTVTYNANDIVQIIGTYGISTHIVFEADEEIRSVALGDTLAWQVAPVHNHLFLKPTETHADTNLSILTSRRAYEFQLSAIPKSPLRRPLYYKVLFNYPDDVAAANAAALTLAHQAQHEGDVAEALRTSESPARKNINYWSRGSQTVTPDETFDDGTFTYFRFRGNREMPAVFLETIVKDKKTESLLNTTVKGDTIVAQRLSGNFILRKGNEVAEVVNQNYDPVGKTTGTGTITSQVTRTVKGEDVPPPASLPAHDPDSTVKAESINVYPPLTTTVSAVPVTSHDPIVVPALPTLSTPAGVSP